MNQRITEYAQQSGAWNYFNDNDITSAKMDKAVLEQFAEVIIKDCINVVNRRYMGDNTREDMEVRRCVNELKDYFGIYQ